MEKEKYIKELENQLIERNETIDNILEKLNMAKNELEKAISIIESFELLLNENDLLEEM